MVILITGGAGFIGSHLVERLIEDQSNHIIVLDNFFTGEMINIARFRAYPNFELIRHDIVEPIFLEVDQIYHLACPAAPVHYQYNPVKTIKTNVQGTLNMLGMARRVNARILLTSTSEVYGDPEVHPQPETYWGHCNPLGKRSCYDEGKRLAESLMMAYHLQNNVDIRIARVFNTYGPRMSLDDGRVISNFILQALRKEQITIFGTGKQTRSFCYVSDLVEGLIRLMEGDYIGPVNLGNPDERSILEIAEKIKELTGSESEIVHHELPEDDPVKRQPDISLAKEILNWEPKISLNEGLEKTIRYFEQRLRNISLNEWEYYKKKFIKRGNSH